MYCFMSFGQSGCRNLTNAHFDIEYELSKGLIYKSRTEKGQNQLII